MNPVDKPEKKQIRKCGQNHEFEKKSRHLNAVYLSGKHLKNIEAF